MAVLWINFFFPFEQIKKNLVNFFPRVKPPMGKWTARQLLYSLVYNYALFSYTSIKYLFSCFCFHYEKNGEKIAKNISLNIGSI